MATMAEAAIRRGRIFGDAESGEYVYMPASEIGAEKPLCIYETVGERRDVEIKEALRLLRVRALRPIRHPILGETSC